MCPAQTRAERLDAAARSASDDARRRGARRLLCRRPGSGPSVCGCATRPATRTGIRRKPSASSSMTRRRRRVRRRRRRRPDADRHRGVRPMSPIVQGEAEIRRRGRRTWLPITTTPSSSGFVARLDDEHLADGAYELRALVCRQRRQRAVDDARPAGHARRAAGAGANQHAARGRSSAASRSPRRDASSCTRLSDTDERSRSRGRLTTPGANPVATPDIEVWEQALGRALQSRRVAVVKTDRRRTVQLQGVQGPSRVLRFRYPARACPRANRRRSRFSVRATTTLRTSRTQVVNGEDITLRGRVLGGPLPSGRQARPAPGVLAREVAHLRHSAREPVIRAVELRLPVHRDARHGPLSLPRARPARERVPRIRPAPRGTST